jgi:hypothetical protein
MKGITLKTFGGKVGENNQFKKTKTLSFSTERVIG